jgi:hypothetical protein
MKTSMIALAAALTLAACGNANSTKAQDARPETARPLTDASTMKQYCACRPREAAPKPWSISSARSIQRPGGSLLQMSAAVAALGACRPAGRA